MHRTFVFPIRCESPQIALNKPVAIKTELGSFICDEEMDAGKGYDAFDHIEIIPDLINLVEKIERVGESWSYWEESDKNTKLVLNWMKKWGYLKAKREELAIGFEKHQLKNFYGQRLSEFLFEAVKFYKLWSLYKAVANRDINTLVNMVEAEEGIDEDEICFIEKPYTFIFFQNEAFRGFSIGEFDENNPLKSYQSASIQYLLSVIENYINEHKLYWTQIHYEPSANEDHFKIKPGMGFLSLLDALYMQFFILLSEGSKRICPVCNRPFPPKRQDQIYHDDSCKLTARSRRYRARKQSII